MSGVAIAYFRCSDLRQEDSIDKQDADVRAMAARDGFQIVRVFQDAGISGWSGKERPGFTAMMRFVKERAKEAGATRLYVWRQNRLGRTMRQIAETLHTIEVRHGVKVQCTAEPTPEDAKARKIMRAITALFDEIYCDDLSENVIGGMRRQAAKGLWVYPHVPYGLRRATSDTPSRLEPDPVTAPIVKRIRDMRLVDFDGHRIIAEQLQRERKAPPGRVDVRSKHQAWTANHVANIMRNRVYTGAITFAGEVVCENAHEALFSLADFEADARLCRERTKSRVTVNPIRIGDHGLLTPWLRCHSCGGRACVRHGGSPARPTHSYGCSDHHNSSREVCEGFSVRVDVLDPLVEARIEADVLTLDGLRALVDASIARLRETPDGARAERRVKLVEEERDLSSRIRKVMDGIEVADDPSDLHERLKELQGRRGTVREDLAALPEPGPLPDSASVDVAAFRQSLLAAWRSKPLLDRRQALSKLVNAVILDPSGVATIRYAWRGEGTPYGVQSPFGPPKGSGLINRGWIGCGEVSPPKTRVIAEF